MKIIRPAIRGVFKSFGYEVVKLARFHQSLGTPNDLQNTEIINRTSDYTMTPPESIHNLLKGVEYVVENHIPGAIVECGVWRGGSMMAVAMKLSEMKVDRPIFLYDTFAGMSKPTGDDVNANGMVADDVLKEVVNHTAAGIDLVKGNMNSTGYKNVRYVEGDVVETLRSTKPDNIAILRLDTDWYESTKAELEHLYPLLSPGGILIVDDYGGWLGARKATDEFFKGKKMLTRFASNGGVMAIK